MSFLKKHRRAIFISILLLVPITFAIVVAWSANEIASPPRRKLMDYHQEFLAKPSAHGVQIQPFSTKDGTPVIVVTPDSVGQLSPRGQKIRNDLTARGITLPPAGKIIGNLVLIHGRKGRKEDYLPIAERLCAVGFRCLLLDLPAHGDNPLPTATYGIHEAKLPATVLAEAAGKFHFEPQPAGLFGMSMGGSVAIHSCAQAAAPWKSLVVVCSFDSFSEVIKEKATARAGETLGNFWFKATDQLYQTKTGISTAAIQPAKLAATLKLPTLIAHGIADKVVPLTAGHHLFDAFPNSIEKSWIEIPGATHDNVLVTDFPIYAEIAAWFLNHIPSH